MPPKVLRGRPTPLGAPWDSTGVDGDAIGELNVATGKPVEDDTLLLLLNAADEPVTFRLPAAPETTGWEVLLDTTFPTGEPDE